MFNNQPCYNDCFVSYCNLGPQGQSYCTYHEDQGCFQTKCVRPVRHACCNARCAEAYPPEIGSSKKWSMRYGYPTGPMGAEMPLSSLLTGFAWSGRAQALEAPQLYYASAARLPDSPLIHLGSSNGAAACVFCAARAARVFLFCVCVCARTRACGLKIDARAHAHRRPAPQACLQHVKTPPTHTHTPLSLSLSRTHRTHTQHKNKNKNTLPARQATCTRSTPRAARQSSRCTSARTRRPTSSSPPSTASRRA